MVFRTCWCLPLLMLPLLAGLAGAAEAPAPAPSPPPAAEAPEAPTDADAHDAAPTDAEAQDTAPTDGGAPDGAATPGEFPASIEGESPVTGVTEGPPTGPLLSPPWGDATLLGVEIAPGEKRRVVLRVSESFAGVGIEAPVLVARGRASGPVLCVTAGVHGDELNGIEVVRSLFEHTTPEGLAGMLVAMPVVNLHGFRRSSRYLPDRRDLNRFFPGNPRGSSASRIASAVFNSVVSGCDALVDLHTGSFHRTNMPHIRADLARPGYAELAKAFGVGVVIHSEGQPGTLRRAAAERGIQALTYEAGEPMRFQTAEIERGVQGIRNLMGQIGMLPPRKRTGRSPLVFYRSAWVRVDDGGIFTTKRSLGDRVKQGDVLGNVTDPISNERGEILAPVTGRIIGMALPQVVIPGFAAFHVGIDASSPTHGEGPLGPSHEPPPDQLDPEEMPE